MTVAVAGVLAYLIGSIPTADWVGRLHGVDPRREGTRNPGTANLVGLAGRRAGLQVLVLDVAKGAVAVVIARLLGGDAAGLVAVVAAPLGQILNPWYGFRGGKGLAVSLGAALVLFPVGVIVGVPAVALGERALGSTARGVLATLLIVVAVATVWGLAGLPGLWGVAPTGGLALAVGALALAVAPKFAADLRTEAPADG